MLKEEPGDDFVALQVARWSVVRPKSGMTRVGEYSSRNGIERCSSARGLSVQVVVDDGMITCTPEDCPTAASGARICSFWLRSR